jgi:hypothetical protein
VDTTAVPVASAVPFLDSEPAFDWRDLRTSGNRAAAILRRLAEDPASLKALLLNVLHDETLLGKCERHVPFDKVVVYDADDRDFRIRLHVWRMTDHERAHQHRFSFTARMLQGHYRHVIYDASPLKAVRRDSGNERDHMDPEHPDAATNVDLAGIRPMLEYDMYAGDGYTLHHDAVHATLVDSQTVSLILRGPAEKEFAFVANLDEGGVYWRFGRRDESAERIRAKQLPREDLAALITELQGRRILA